MSRINDRKTHARRGFTLVEVLVATSLLAIVLAGVLAAYLFLGRSLTRLVNLQQQEMESRRILRVFTQDLSAAIGLSAATVTQLTFTKQNASTTATIDYTFSAANGTLVRTEGAASQTMLTGLTSLTFTYYSEAGATVTGSPQSVKSVELSFASAVGTAASGTRAAYTTVSPRVVLRNKAVLQ